MLTFCHPSFKLTCSAQSTCNSRWWVVRAAGCGLPPGPSGSLGALEGISYLAVAGAALWSLVYAARSGNSASGD